jgi:hypothetical protein
MPQCRNLALVSYLHFRLSLTPVSAYALNLAPARPLGLGRCVPETAVVMALSERLEAAPSEANSTRSDKSHCVSPHIVWALSMTFHRGLSRAMPVSADTSRESFVSELFGGFLIVSL